MRVTTLIVATALALGLTIKAHAGVLVHYDNPGAGLGFDSGVPHEPVFVDPLVQASAVSIIGVQGVNHIEAFQTNHWSAGPIPDPAKYIHFSLAPVLGYALQFESFDIDLWQSRGGDGTRKFSLRSQGDGFSSDIFSSPIVLVPANPTNSSYHFALAGLSPRTGETEFRLYFYDVASDGQNYSLISMGTQGKGFAVNGSVISVPEPSTGALLALGIGLLWCGRKYLAGVRG